MLRHVGKKQLFPEWMKWAQQGCHEYQAAGNEQSQLPTDVRHLEGREGSRYVLQDSHVLEIQTENPNQRAHDDDRGQ